MKFIQTTIIILLASITALAASKEEADAGPKIPEDAIQRLREMAASAEDIESTTQRRRECKRIVRGAESLIKQHPQSPNRFNLLSLMYETQKALFTMRQSDEYREALLETAGALMEAPDERADLRVEPEMMLLQIALSNERSSPEESSLAIARFADRYRDTSAEARSLIMAATVAFDLGNRNLLDAFRRMLSTRFRHDPLVAAFMRERFAAGSEVHLRGAFRRADGKRISFPLGQTYVACFWSQDAPLLKEKVAEVKALQNRYKGQVKVFSFNLDERSDGGAGILRRWGLDWTPVLLPGGAENPAYRSVGGANMFSALVVGPHGLAGTGAIRRHPSPLHKRYEATMESSRYLALLRSLLTGEFLLNGASVRSEKTAFDDTLVEIRACFPPPPLRYRLTPQREADNYEKAERLCADTIALHPRAPGLRVLNNYRTIALLGMWRMSGDLEYLDRAEIAARAALAGSPPAFARTIPRFCIATRALTDADADAAQVLADFIRATGGPDAPATAHAAALMLSLEAHSPDQYARFRDTLLLDHVEDPSASCVTSFLLDHSSATRLFGKALPGGGTGIAERPFIYKRFKANWTTREGRQLQIPTGDPRAIRALAVIEPTRDSRADALRKQIVHHLTRIAATRARKDFAVTGVFLASDTKGVAAMIARNKWSFETVVLPPAVARVMVRELGIFSPDLRPSVFLIDGGGGIKLALSGISRDTERHDTLTRRIDDALREHDLAIANEVLAAKDYAEYAARLATSFPLKHRRRSRYEPEWRATSAHRRKLVWAHMKNGDWKRALAEANANIGIHLGQHKMTDPRNPKVWCRTCYGSAAGPVFGMFIRVALLREMGRHEEAAEALEMAQAVNCPETKDLKPLWADVEAHMANRRGRWRHWQDPKRFLAEHGKLIRASRQSLYDFRIQHDLMMRSRIHEAIGNMKAAQADSKHARLLEWPFKIREFDLSLLHEASVKRRTAARDLLASGKWKRGYDLVNTNITLHEAEPVRCNSSCWICSTQVQNFTYYARTLRGLGRVKDADAALAMAGDSKCPPGKDRETHKRFPINRMYGGGSGVNRLRFIEGIMRGEGYADRRARAYRLEFAADLIIRAQALEQLGETEKAEKDRKRATALAYPLGPNSVGIEDELPSSYVDILSLDSDKK